LAHHLPHFVATLSRAKCFTNVFPPNPPPKFKMSREHASLEISRRSSRFGSFPFSSHYSVPGAERSFVLRLALPIAVVPFLRTVPTTSVRHVPTSPLALHQPSLSKFTSFTSIDHTKVSGAPFFPKKDHQSTLAREPFCLISPFVVSFLYTQVELALRTGPCISGSLSYPPAPYFLVENGLFESTSSGLPLRTPFFGSRPHTRT